MKPNDDTMLADTLASSQGHSSRSGHSGHSGDFPATIGRFEIESKLGQGGMGVVLLGKDPLLGRRIAIKVLRGKIDDVAKRRLLREAQGTAQLSHENVIVVHEVGTHDDQVYLAMEYIAGQTLLRRQARCGWREILELYVQAGRGLQAAHDAGLVHRDFKPENVLVGDDGRLRVTDFGLVATDNEAVVSTPSSVPELGSKLTETGAVMGTPRYMAPEQHLGEQVDGRADQFSFCVALYEALYGQQPFAGATYKELAANVIGGNVTTPPPSDVPERVCEVLMRGLSRDRNDRHSSMREVLALLAVEPPRTARSRWPLTAVIAGALVALTAVTFVVVRPGGEGRPVVVEAAMSSIDATSLMQAQIAFDEGHMAFLQGNHDEAARQFELGHRSLRVPQMIYNQAASLLMKGKREGDVSSYRRATELYTEYLASDPAAPGVASTVDAIVAEIERLEAGGDRKAAAVPEPELRGLVVVISEPPGATVYVDDPAKGPQGTTPWSGTLDGEHKIFLAKQGYDMKEHTNTYDRRRFDVFQIVMATSP